MSWGGEGLGDGNLGEGPSALPAEGLLVTRCPHAICLL